MKYLICIFALTVALTLIINDSPAFARNLRTEDPTPADVTGTFTLILYGGRYFRDVETVAILDLEGDHYTFEPYGSQGDRLKVKFDSRAGARC